MKKQMELIKNKKQYAKALQRFEEIFLAEECTQESKEADTLSLLIKDYEEKHFVTAPVKPRS